MKKIYKLEINNAIYWKTTNFKKGYFLERTDKPCNLYLKKADLFISDNMFCNYINANPKNTLSNGVRLKDDENYVVIEPSGIIVPKSDIIEVPSVSKDAVINNNLLTKTTFLCNLMSDSTRGGKEIITPEELNEFENELLYQNNQLYNPACMSPVEFLNLFLYVCFSCYHIRQIDRNKLLELIIKNKKIPGFINLLWNIRVEMGEHYDTSKDLDNALNFFIYCGVLSPDYNETNPYTKLNINPHERYYFDLKNNSYRATMLVSDLVSQYNKEVVKQKNGK